MADLLRGDYVLRVRQGHPLTVQRRLDVCSIEHERSTDMVVPPPPPYLDCGDVSHAAVQGAAAGPHDFDADAEGIGCESG